MRNPHPRPGHHRSRYRLRHRERETDGKPPGKAIISGGGGAVAAVIVGGIWLLVETARRKLTRGLLALTPSGVHHRSWAFHSYVPWTAITSVSTGQAREGPLITMAVLANTEPRFHRTSRLWKQDEFRLAPHIAIKTAYLSVDPALAYHALTYYHTHPNARPELATPAALDRLRTARLPA